MRIKKLKACPFCFDTQMLKYQMYCNIVEICCVPCRLTRQIEYPKTTIDKKTKQERETTREERLNYAIEKWNEYDKRETNIFTDGLVKGYTLGVEDTENGEPYKFLRGE